MKVRVLGCSGAIARDCRTTSFLVDDHLLVDAGTGVGDLTLQEMQGIDHVLLTHAHLDHVAALPLMIDAVASHRSAPVQVHALPETLAALRAHVFNNTIWPDFTRIPTPERPWIELLPLAVGQPLTVLGKRIEALPAIHTVPAVGYAVQDARACWVFSGDTGPNPAFWRRVNQLPVSMLVIETAFSNQEQDVAELSLHLSPHLLANELAAMAPQIPYPIYITHTKPAEAGRIMREVEGLPAAAAPQPPHDIRWLRAGQVFEL